LLPSILIEARELSLIAAPGVTPVLRFEIEERDGDPAFMVSDGDVRFEGIIFEMEAREDELDEEEEFNSEEEEDIALIECQQGTLTATRCRFVSSSDGGCLNIEAARVELSHCEIHAGPGVGISYTASQGSKVELKNCVLTGETNILVTEPEEASLVLEHNTLFGFVSLRWMPNEERESAKFVIHADRNLFDAEETLFFVEADSITRRDWKNCLQWQGTSNWFPETLVSWGDVEESEPPPWAKDLSEWTVIENISDSGSKQQTPDYRLARETLLTRLVDRELAAGDLKLAIDSESVGFALGNDLKTTGPDRE